MTQCSETVLQLSNIMSWHSTSDNQGTDINLVITTRSPRSRGLLSSERAFHIIDRWRSFENKILRISVDIYPTGGLVPLSTVMTKCDYCLNTGNYRVNNALVACWSREMRNFVFGVISSTHWGCNKVAAIFGDGIFIFILPNENFWILNTISLKYVS